MARLKTALVADFREQRLLNDHHAAARRVGTSENQERETRGFESKPGRESSKRDRDSCTWRGTIDGWGRQELEQMGCHCKILVYMNGIQTAVYRYGMRLQKGRATRQMRDMEKRSISERENYAKTLLCIHRKRNLTNIHDNQIKLYLAVKRKR